MDVDFVCSGQEGATAVLYSYPVDSCLRQRHHPGEALIRGPWRVVILSHKVENLYSENFPTVGIFKVKYRIV